MICSTVLCLLVACACLMMADGFTTLPFTHCHDNTALYATNSNHEISRRNSLFKTAAVITTIPLPAFAAKEVDPAVKGTKKDPSYEACVSQCMYDCTKPKGTEQKSRQECLPECKKQCATTKEQLMKGTPVK